MSLASPVWLLLLIPWLAVLLYLMLGKPPREEVPFLWLWRGPAAKRTSKPSLSKLPLWIALLMLAALSAIIAATGPGILHDAPLATSQAQVGVTAAAVRGEQLMLRLLNESSRRDIPIKLKWASLDGDERTTVLQLPESGERTYFLDLPSGVRDLTVFVDDRTVSLAHIRTWPRIEPRLPLADSLRRVIDAYTGTRPAGDDSAVIGIAADEPSLGGAGVILAEPTFSNTGKPVVTDHPVTRDVNWSAVLEGVRTASPPEGYTPLVKVDDATAVAVRSNPNRLWVGFNSPAFVSRVDYVVFWTNVFDFVGEGVDTWKLAPGTMLATPKSPVVQKVVQNVAPWLMCTSVILLTLGLLTAQRPLTASWSAKLP